MSPCHRFRGSGLIYVPRKLKEIHQELDLLAGQGGTAGFLADAESVQRISDLVEDIREVMMDYQVRALAHSSLLSCPTNTPDFIATGYL